MISVKILEIVFDFCKDCRDCIWLFDVNANTERKQIIYTYDNLMVQLSVAGAKYQKVGTTDKNRLQIWNLHEKVCVLR